MKALALLLLTLTCARPDQGQHPVGYRDGLWYPAAEGGDVMRFRDYVPRLEDWDMRLHAIGFTDGRIVDLFDTDMRARLGASALPQPVARIRLVHQPGELAADYAFIAEFLASHGYEVTLHEDSTARPVDARSVTTLRFLQHPGETREAARKLFRELGEQ